MGVAVVGTRFEQHHCRWRRGRETRRDFIHIAAMAVAGGGAALVAWPFIQQLAPASDTRALSSADVDISKVP